MRWVNYIRERRRKQAQELAAVELHANRIQGSFFGVWQDEYTVVKAKIMRADAVLAAKRKFLMRQCFGALIRYWHSRKVVFN